jgi:hypothetical protein
VSRAAEATKRAVDNLSWTFSKTYRLLLHSVALVALVWGTPIGAIVDQSIPSPKDALR